MNTNALAKHTSHVTCITEIIYTFMEKKNQASEKLRSGVSDRTKNVLVREHFQEMPPIYRALTVVGCQCPN